MWKDKRGVSPLIAAVLLIVVVVGVGAVVTGIVRNYVTTGKQTIQSKSGDIKCGAEIDVSVPTVADQIRICKNDHNITFTLDNTGSTKVDDLQMKIFSADKVWANNSIDSNGLDVGATESYVVDYSDSGISETDIVEVQIIPRVKVVGRSDFAYCTDSALKFNPQPCNP